jgi:uncharacterized ferritin-like protein (DUF455 family)
LAFIHQSFGLEDPMELSAFAKQVLFATSLDEKLWSPSSFGDESPGPGLAVAPIGPGRPVHLPLEARRPIPAAPTPAQLQHESVRGQALHTFAHHELQALELMALALLRFPGAPPGFRLGLAHIIRDEQKHFRLYQARAQHWGVGIGDVGTGRFFWDTVAPIEDLPAFVAALSLTYEQANLDFALYWKSAFGAIDDAATVTVLQTVYEDEVRHVRHGLEWFRHLTGDSSFESYRKHLVFPLSTGRAKGPIFDRAGREKVGFETAFIDEVEIANISRGRPPVVLSFNPFVESELAGVKVKPQVRKAVLDLSSLMMFLGHKEDVVLAPRPGLKTLQRLYRAGFEVPQFAADLDALGARTPGELRPWAKTEYPELYDKTWAFAQRHAFSNTAQAPILAPEAGGICRSLEQVGSWISTGGTWLAKAPFSTSGQHRVRVQAPLDPRHQRWIERQLLKGPVLIEPWYDKVLDLSVQVQVEADRVRVLGFNRFLTAGSGVYRGAIIGKWSRSVSPELARALHMAQLPAQLEAAGHWVGERARIMGYTGPLGVDAMVVRISGSLRLVPILEVNPRYTMGRIAMALQRRCTGYGRWCFVDRQRISEQPGGLAGVVQAVNDSPMVVNGGSLREGVLFTTEPNSAHRTLTLLCVAHSHERAQALWASVTGGNFEMITCP